MYIMETRVIEQKFHEGIIELCQNFRHSIEELVTMYYNEYHFFTEDELRLDAETIIRKYVLYDAYGIDLKHNEPKYLPLMPRLPPRSVKGGRRKRTRTRKHRRH